MQRRHRSWSFKTCSIAIFLIALLSWRLFYLQHNFRRPAFAPPHNDSEHEYYLDRSGPSKQTAPSVNFIDLDKQDLSFVPYDPYPHYNTRQWKNRWQGSHKACKGPRGVNVNGNPDDMLVARSVGPTCKCYGALTAALC